MLLRTIRRFSFNYPCPRNLREIMQMSLVERESPDVVKHLWEEFHAERKDNIAMTLDPETYDCLKSSTRESSMFLFPIKREGGHFMMVSQSQDRSILFTSMLDYKQNQIFSNPYFVFTFFEELKDTKNLVLARGDIIDQRVARAEARDLVKNLLSFYLNGDLYEKFVVPFNHDASKFDYSTYCKHFDIDNS